jgi:hypothetical protein
MWGNFENIFIYLCVYSENSCLFTPENKITVSIVNEKIIIDKI